MASIRPGTEESVGSEIKEETAEPPMYKVFLLNDDYTTMDFVVYVLMAIFQKTPEEATAIMWKVHKSGSGLCGVYTRDVAETKVDAVHSMAREHDFPLKCLMERE